LDGSRPEIHDRFRGKGSFEKTMHGIELLMKADIKIYPRLTLCEENKDDVIDYVNLVHSLGLDTAYLRRMIPSGNSADRRPMNAGDLKNFFSFAYQRGHELGIHIGSSDYFAQIYFDEEERNKAEKNLQASDGETVLSGCSMGINALYVAQDGKVLFCPYLPVVCGDMIEKPLRQIWEESEMFSVARNLRYNMDGKCQKCKWLMCCGGCPAYAYLTTGSLTTSDPGCWINEPKNECIS